MTPIEILKAIKEDIRDKFEADPLMMRTMNLVITEFEARTERLHKHNVVDRSEQLFCSCDKWHDRMEESNNNCSTCDKRIV